MRIVSSPTPYSPAYREVLFGLSAATDEQVEIDIYNHAGVKILGRRRFCGSTAYNVNVAAYAKNQFEIAPLRSFTCTFAQPDKRIVNVPIQSGSVRAKAVLCAGTRTLYSGEKLSARPEETCIAFNETDEIAILPYGEPIDVKAVLKGTQSKTLALATLGATESLAVFCLSMRDLQNRLRTAGGGSLQDYRTLEVVFENEGATIFLQRYRIAPKRAGTVRLCWWNVFGQIDCYTMRSTLSCGYGIRKERVYTPDGYRVTASSRESLREVVSDYENAEMMEWLSGMLNSPGVWVDDGTQFTPVDILGSSVVISGEAPARLRMTIRETRGETFQNY